MLSAVAPQQEGPWGSQSKDMQKSYVTLNNECESLFVPICDDNGIHPGCTHPVAVICFVDCAVER